MPVLFGIDKYRECTVGSGQSYRGTKAVTKSGSRCIQWDSPAVRHKHNNAWRSNGLELGLGSHSFCRYRCQNTISWNKHTWHVSLACRTITQISQVLIASLLLYETGIQMVMWVHGVTPTKTCGWPGSSVTFLNAVSSLDFIVSVLLKHGKRDPRNQLHIRSVWVTILHAAVWHQANCTWCLFFSETATCDPHSRPSCPHD